MLATGHMERLPEAFAALERVIGAATDPFVRGWGWGTICLAAPAVDPPRILIGVEECQRDAARFGCPFSRLGAAYYLVMKKVFVDDPPDYDGALGAVAQALQEARRLGDRHFVGHLLLQDVFTTLMADRPLDPRSLVAALDELYDTRNWLMTWVALESTVIALFAFGEPHGRGTAQRVPRTQRAAVGRAPTLVADEHGRSGGGRRPRPGRHRACPGGCHDPRRGRRLRLERAGATLTHVIAG